MSIRVHLTVELDDGGNNKVSFTKEGSRASDNAWFSPAVTEALIAQLGSAVLKQIVTLRGDIREQAPNAAGLTDELRARPLTDFERGRLHGYEQGIAAAEEYAEAAEADELAAAERRS